MDNSIFVCKNRHIKQCVPKPVENRSAEKPPLPGPTKYAPPSTIGGKGYSKIKRAPAYTIGVRIPLIPPKPAAVPTAPIYDITGYTKKGPYKIPQGPIGTLSYPPEFGAKIPGPNEYLPKTQVKRPPAYSIKPPAHKHKEPWDMWTPGPNMYLPPIPAKKEPAYSFGNEPRMVFKPALALGPGEHDVKYKMVERKKPAYSFGHPYRNLPPPTVPPPNAYCHHKFKLWKKTVPAPSFGIRHSKYLGQSDNYLLPTNFQVSVSGE